VSEVGKEEGKVVVVWNMGSKIERSVVGGKRVVGWKKGW